MLARLVGNASITPFGHGTYKVVVASAVVEETTEEDVVASSSQVSEEVGVVGSM